MYPLKVLFFSNNTLSVAGVKMMLEKESFIKKTTHINELSALHDCLLTNEFNLVILEYDNAGNLTNSDIKNLQDNFPELSIVVIISEDLSSEILLLIELKIHACIPQKQCSNTEIIEALQQISNGQKYYCDKMLAIAYQQKEKIQSKKFTQLSFEKDLLSRREQEIVLKIVNGNTNKQIADQLELSIHTVHTHRRNIMKKLSINNISELIKYAINKGVKL